MKKSLALLVAVLLPLGAIAALDVRLEVADDSGAERRGGTVSSGVPFAQGAVRELGRLSVSAGGRKIPAQFRELARWPDGSVRWALMDCLVDVPANGKTELALRDDSGNPAPSAPVHVVESGNTVRISTGSMEMVLDKTSANFLSSVTVEGRELVTGKSRGLTLYTAGELKTETPVDSRGRPLRPTQIRLPGQAVPAAPPTEVDVEEAGPVKAVVRLRGEYPGVHKAPVTYTVRLTVWAGQPFFKARVWLENQGAHGYTTSKDDKKGSEDNEWFAFNGLALELDLDLGGKIEASCEGVAARGKFRVYQYCKNAPKHPLPAYGYRNMAYEITGPPEPKTGSTTDGVTTFAGNKGRMTTAVRHFWENYEKAIELDGQTLSVWLWPREGLWPRAFFNHPAPGYSTSHVQPLRLPDAYNLPGSVHKGYEMIFDFSARSADQTRAELSRPLFALASAEYYAGAEAAPVLFAPPNVRTGDREGDRALDAWTNMSMSAADRESPSGIWHGRTTRWAPGNAFNNGFWYGWMEFGDIPCVGNGYTSLAYDWPRIMCMNLLRFGKPDFLRLADEMVRHLTEIDWQWSDREAVKSTLGFRRGSGYAHFHCQRFNRSLPGVTSVELNGLVFYYLLTGDRKTREAIDRTAGYFEEAWETLFASQVYGDRQIVRNMRVASRAIDNGLALYTLTAEKKWLDMAQSIFQRSVMPMAEAHGPHLHSPQQWRGQGYAEEDVNYCYAISTFCHLHRLTGDKEILDMLQAGADTPFPDDNFFEAPLYLADLNAYIAMTAGKADYAEEAMENWIKAFPESASPTVFLPNNSAWHREKAMHMRTGHWLQFHYWKQTASKR